MEKAGWCIVDQDGQLMDVHGQAAMQPEDVLLIVRTPDGQKEAERIADAMTVDLGNRCTAKQCVLKIVL